MRYEQKREGQGLEAGVTREFTGVLVCRDWEADVIANTSIEAEAPAAADVDPLRRRPPGPHGQRDDELPAPLGLAGRRVAEVRHRDRRGRDPRHDHG